MIGPKRYAATLLVVILVVMGVSAGVKLCVPDRASASSSEAEPRTIEGDVASTPTGPLQVQITVSGSEIVAIDELQSATAYTRSRAINSRAIPILTHEALAAQSAEIDSVSGATYTSEAYRKSLQSAIDRR